ncbi:DUF1080 domain-containing protein [Algoriphagus boritolerans]|uniref:3-keto-disaccharide hydrolase n=1 Tax=Algoriphagus boritolerans TaxID=308111 RepID=UPI000B21ACF6
MNIILVSLVILISGTLPVLGQGFENTRSVFDGKTMKGWHALPEKNRSLWKVQDSVLVGGDGVLNIAENNYLYTTDNFEDFEFRCLFRLTGDSKTGLINSGIQYRSRIINGNMVGYQADIGNGYWGDIYDEHRRGKLVGGDLQTLKHLLREDGWNSYIIRVKGDFHELYINGVKTNEYQEKDSSVPKSGLIGIQLHSGGNAKIEFRDLTITHISEN